MRKETRASAMRQSMPRYTSAQSRSCRCLNDDYCCRRPSRARDQKTGARQPSRTRDVLVQPFFLRLPCSNAARVAYLRASGMRRPPLRTRRLLARRSCCARQIRRSTPTHSLAEHSRYRTAPIFCATAAPYRRQPCESSQRTSWAWTGRWFTRRSSSIVFGSLRRSCLQPTRMIGNPEQK